MTTQVLTGPESMRRPMLSGFCLAPAMGSTITPRTGSHDRCKGGNTANPEKSFQPCPCECHIGEFHECGGCGGIIVEALEIPWGISDGITYMHFDPESGLMTSPFCRG